MATSSFARVQDQTALYEALKAGTLTAEKLPDLLPKVDVLRLTPGQNEAQPWLADAAEFALTLK